MDNRIPTVLARLATSPAALVNLAAYRLFRRQRTAGIRYLPFVLDIEPTSYCNFKCAMCHVSDPDFPHRHMDLDLFKHIVDSNPQLLKIHLQGMGEPLLCPSLFEMIAYARKRHIVVQTTTNGSLLTTERAERLANAGLASIGVSIDGATADTYEAVRACSDFGKVIEGVRRLAAAVRQAGSDTDVRAWTVVQKGNVDELPAIVELCKSLGFSALTFQTFLSTWGKQEWAERTGGMSAGAQAEAALASAVDRGRAIGFTVNIRREDKYSAGRLCTWPWYSVFVDAAGEMVPCCILGDARVRSFGNLGSHTLRERWYGEEWSAFRRSHATNKYPGFCKGCYGN